MNKNQQGQGTTAEQGVVTRNQGVDAVGADALYVDAEIYRLRFTDRETKARSTVWEVLTKHFLQQFVREGDSVLDIGAGDGWFLRHIHAARKIALDLNPQVKQLEKFGIESINARADELSKVLPSPVDVILLSNFLEHLPTKQAVFEVLTECRKVLSSGGRLLVLQPNIRFVGAAYWDYIDHHIALTERSLAEALEVTGFRVELLLPRFLPYTAKSRSGALAGGTVGKLLITLYLKCPVLWKVFGGQIFAVAIPRS